MTQIYVVIGEKQRKKKSQLNILKSQEKPTYNPYTFLQVIYKVLKMIYLLLSTFRTFGIEDIMRKFVIWRIFHDSTQVETSTDDELQTWAHLSLYKLKEVVELGSIQSH